MLMYGFLLARLFKLVTKSCVLDMNKRFRLFWMAVVTSCFQQRLGLVV